MESSTAKMNTLAAKTVEKGQVQAVAMDGLLRYGNVILYLSNSTETLIFIDFLGLGVYVKVSNYRLYRNFYHWVSSWIVYLIVVPNAFD